MTTCLRDDRFSNNLHLDELLYRNYEIMGLISKIMFRKFLVPFKVDSEYQPLLPDVASTFIGGSLQCRGSNFTVK